jgi:pyrimidine operon attenuation protein/uracil phosphoribosyltransferase
VGLQTGGVSLALRLRQKMTDILGGGIPPLGKLDITFYRDDFKQKKLSGSAIDMPFLVEEKQVVLIDDVLYTGRSVSAALSALSDYGRAASIDLLVLVDRRFQRQIPIQPDFFGIAIDTLDEAYVEVVLDPQKTGGQVLLFPKKH